MNFKKILGMTTDNGILKLAHANLGKIYFNQSLYKESLAHFAEALKIDDRDQILKIWIGKDYSALGDKTKARAIWTEVLTADRSNEEVKKLLGLM
jgi:tetratricopeptide (TPR) repeat protein